MVPRNKRHREARLRTQAVLAATAQAAPNQQQREFILSQTPKKGRGRPPKITTISPKMAPFKDEHVLMIAPGSQTTMAQLGIPESFTPAALKIPSRMFPTDDKNKWEPVKIRVKKPAAPTAATNGATTSTTNGTEDAKPTTTNGDVAMTDASLASAANGEHKEGGDEEEEVQYEEDPTSDEGAVWPIKFGKIVHWPAFFALLDHVHSLLSPPFHSPILIVSDPSWTIQDKEKICGHIFEKFKTPGYYMLDSALAATYAYGGAMNAIVVDVGLDKISGSAVVNSHVEHAFRAICCKNHAGNQMTDALYESLKSKGWTWDMCEQLKKSPICEILPWPFEFPTVTETAQYQPLSSNANPAAAASTGGGQRVEGAPPVDQEGSTIVGGLTVENGNMPEVEDGVLDIASLVASGKTKEFLARQEKQKADKAAKKAAADSAAATAKANRLPNSKRPTNIFAYEERRIITEEEVQQQQQTQSQSQSKPKTETIESQSQRKSPEPPASATTTTAPTEPAVPSSGDVPPPTPVEDAAKRQQQQQDKAARKEERKEERRQKKQQQQTQGGVVRRELEVGIERFNADDCGVIAYVAELIWGLISKVDELALRGELWNNIILVGNGTKIKGFKESVLALLNAQYLISPSSATIFTSELPSNLSTPLATGANTPQPQLPGSALPLPPTGSGVNRLLVAATANQLQQQQSQPLGLGLPSKHHPQQVPTSIRFTKMPEYFPEWRKDPATAGMEEATFLGAQLMAKLVFVSIDKSAAAVVGGEKLYMSRQDYNECGPAGAVSGEFFNI